MRSFLMRVFRKESPEELWLPVWFLKIVDVVWPVHYFRVGVVHDIKGFRRNARLYIDRAGYLFTVTILGALLARQYGTTTDYDIGLGFVAVTTVLFAATAFKTVRVMRMPPDDDEASF
jgi:hypothetical protein